LSQVYGYLRDGIIRADVAFVHLSAPDERGEYSYSIANDFQQAAIARARVEARPQPIGPVEEAIARHVGRYIEDGTTIQIGIGAIPDAVMASIGDRRDLGLHSGLISDRIADLIESGAMTNARKPIDTGIAVACSVLGTTRVYRFAHRNPALKLFTLMHTHRAEVLCQLGRIVAINSAVEADLTGQINAEVASGAY